MSKPRLRSRLLVSGALLLALAACREEAAPSAAAPLPATTYALYAYAPEPGAAIRDLPAAPPAPVGELAQPREGYAWAERAYALDTAFYDEPPDYGFAYDGVEPWAWETEDDWRMYAEPVDAGYRYYYYAPGADYPYFVRDPDYGYGYDDGGRLVTLYDGRGALMPMDRLYQRADIAGRYRSRAYALHRAGVREHRRRVSDEVWSARAPLVRRTQVNWIEAARERPEWLDYRARNGERDLKRFDKERSRRHRQEARLDARGERAERRDGWSDEGGRQRLWAPADPNRREAREERPRQDRRDDWRGDRRERAEAQAERRRHVQNEPRREDRGRAERQAHEQRQAQAERRQQVRQEASRKARHERQAHEQRQARPERREHVQPPHEERGRPERQAHEQRQAPVEHRQQAQGQARHEARGRRDRQAQEQRPAKAEHRQAARAEAHGERGQGRAQKEARDDGGKGGHDGKHQGRGRERDG